MAFRLAEFFVEFTAKNIAAVQAGIDTVGKSILGFTTAGLVGTTQGNLLTFMFGELAREITAIALPAIQNLTIGLQHTLDWFRNLSGGQQDLIFKFGALAVSITVMTRALTFMGIAATGPLGILLRIVGALVAMEGGSGPVATALGKIATQVVRILDALSPLLKILETVMGFIGDVVAFQLELLAGALEKVGDFLEFIGVKSAQKKAEDRTAHRSMDRTGGGVEGVADTYRRLQQSALSTDVNWPRRGVEIAQQQLEVQHETNRLLDRGRPAVTR